MCVLCVTMSWCDGAGNICVVPSMGVHWQLHWGWRVGQWAGVWRELLARPLSSLFAVPAASLPAAAPCAIRAAALPLHHQHRVCVEPKVRCLHGTA